MGRMRVNGTTRRHFLASASATVGGVIGGFSARPGRAQPKQLRILRARHFVPAYDEWFLESFVPGWAEANATDVIVDSVGLADVARLAAEEAAAGHGHDIVHSVSPPARHEDQLIDHRDIYEAAAASHGAPPDFVWRGSSSPRSGKVFCFCESFATTLASYRRDLWDSVGRQPLTWDDVRRGGGAIKLLHGKAVGISLAAEHNAEHSLRALLYAFGGAVQDADGRPALASADTLEALRFGKALFEEAMSEEVLAWDPPANNRFMLSGDGALTIDTLSIPRAAESTGVAIEPDLALAPLPEGPAGRIGPNFGFYSFAIWQFAENLEGARQFLIDYVASSRDALLASGFQNMPSFSGAVPDLDSVLQSDPVRPQRYAGLAEAATAVTNLGHPGHTSAAVDEVMAEGVVSTMFRSVATGEATPEDAMSLAAARVDAVFERWREAGKI